MEEPHSVNSPRRILSFSKRRRTTTASVSFVDPDEKPNSGFGVSGEHGPKPSEVYGFVGSITTVVATAIFLVWAYIPEPWLHSVGIFYYPSRYWALAVPTYAMVVIVLAILFYIGLNFMSTPPPTSLANIFVVFCSVVINARYRISGTHVNPLGLKSDAPMDVICDIMRCWVKNHLVKAQTADQAGSVILAKEPVLQANSARAVASLSKAQAEMVARFLPNPKRHWGPELRAGRQITSRHIALLGEEAVNGYLNHQEVRVMPNVKGLRML